MPRGRTKMAAPAVAMWQKPVGFSPTLFDNFDCTSAQVYHIKIRYHVVYVSLYKVFLKIFWVSCFLQCVTAHSQAQMLLLLFGL